MKYIVLFLFIAVNLAFAEYDPINKDERLIENGVFVGKKDSYSYFEIEAYGVWIEKKYKKDEWNRIAEYRDYL